jgi:hypothetical protein
MNVLPVSLVILGASVAYAPRGYRVSALQRIAASIAAFFVDDGSLAICIALILATVGFVESTPWCDDRILGAALVVAVIAALLANIRRASRYRTRRFRAKPTPRCTKPSRHSAGS